MQEKSPAISSVVLLHSRRHTCRHSRTLGNNYGYVTVNRLKANLETVVEKQSPRRATRRSGEVLVVMSADDWEREQETLYVLQNSSLVKQIFESIKTHKKGKGYKPGKED